MEQSSWPALGSGMGGSYPSVTALAVSGGSLYGGGNFDTAGTNVSDYAAEAILVPSTTPPFVVTTNGSFGFTNGASQFGFDISGSQAQTVVLQGNTDLSNWVPLQTNVQGSSLFYFNDPASNFASRFYRAE